MSGETVLWILPPLIHMSFPLGWIVLDKYYLFLPSHFNSPALTNRLLWWYAIVLLQSQYNMSYWLGHRITLLLITVIIVTNIYIIHYDFLSAHDMHYLIYSWSLLPCVMWMVPKVLSAAAYIQYSPEGRPPPVRATFMLTFDSSISRQWCFPHLILKFWRLSLVYVFADYNSF